MHYSLSINFTPWEGDSREIIGKWSPIGRFARHVVNLRDLWHNHHTMNIVTLPYGNTGLGEKNRLIEEVISLRPGPPFMYNDVLILVPAARMKRSYGRLFL